MKKIINETKVFCNMCENDLTNVKDYISTYPTGYQGDGVWIFDVSERDVKVEIGHDDFCNLTCMFLYIESQLERSN